MRGGTHVHSACPESHTVLGRHCQGYHIALADALCQLVGHEECDDRRDDKGGR